ncbi:MAG: hypothetical protein RID42_16005 [Alphaproteobacteria bacterium]
MGNRTHLTLTGAIAAGLLAVVAPAEAGKERLRAVEPAEQPVLVQNNSRRIPQRSEEAIAPIPPADLSRVGPPQPNLPSEFIPVPDRWRLIDNLGVRVNFWDPYNQNTLKADRPIPGTEDFFFNLAVISDTVIEPRRLPTPISPNSSQKPGSLDTFGEGEQLFYLQNLVVSLSFLQGDTAYRPPDIEFRFTPVFNFTRAEVEERAVLRRDPRDGTVRNDVHVGIQEAFFDYHIRNVSRRFDFDSFRIGIQPFSTDFRGFLFQDNQLGFRIFGNRDNNLFQYNLGYFRRIEKDTNSGLNDFGEEIRKDEFFVANLYLQDLPRLGFVSQFTILHNRNDEDSELFFNKNNFIERPASFGDERLHKYNVTYLGYNGDGRVGRAQLTTSFYYAFGEDTHNQLNGNLIDDNADIRAYFFAAEPSFDFDWIRVRGSFLLASGDSDPFDKKEEGFSALFENPQFAGGDTSFWIRQGIPLIGGGGVQLTQRNGVLAELRTSKEHGQSNFNNPGIVLVGLGTDFDVSPEVRISTNFNNLRFEDTSNLQVLRNQGEIDEEIGWDLSAAVIWRPLFIQNIVMRLSAAALVPGPGFKDLFATSQGGDDEILYSILANGTLSF